MHKLNRNVRFSINPFLDSDAAGDNSFCCKPSGEGLAIFLELVVGVVGAADEDTGFVINIVEIDEIVRKCAVPVLSERIRKRYRAGKHIGIDELCELLRICHLELEGKFGAAGVCDLHLKLNPYRTLSIDCEDMKMVYYSEKFEFAAMHKLWNKNFDDDQNFQMFGKCANKSGHGHNYTIEVAVKWPQEQSQLQIGKFQRIVSDELIELIDHKNLNEDIAYFGDVNPTVENIAVFAWDKLVGRFDIAQLHAITVWETDKTSCTYYG